MHLISIVLHVHTPSELEVANIPVIVQCKLNDPIIAEKALQEGKTDFTAIGHQLLADPHWANKIKEGRIKEMEAARIASSALMQIR